MKHAFYSGISGKTALVFLAAFLLVILPVNIFIYSRLKETLTKADIQHLQLEADKLMTQVNLDPLTVPLPPAGYLILLQATDGQINQVLFSSPRFPAIEDAGFFPEPFDLDSLSILTVRKPIEMGTGEIWLSIARSNQNLKDQLADFRLYLFYVTGAVVGFILMIVFLISNTMLRPIKKIIEASESIASADQLQNLPVPISNDESRQLALALNAMLKRISESNETQQRFFDSATHELKTPLSVMKAELALIQQSATADAHVKTVMQGVMEEVNRLERTILDFLLASQLKSKTLTLRKEQVNLPELVYTALKNLKRLADERQLSILINQADSIDITAVADLDKILIVVTNLLENAIRYSPGESTIHITLQEDGFEIQNTSTSKILYIEKLGKERHSSNPAGGMGLGLWICRQIVDLHAFTLSLSQHEDQFIAKVAFKTSPTLHQTHNFVVNSLP